MDHLELKARIDAVTQALEAATQVDAQSASNKIFGALLLTGIAVVGEMLLDVKRIADAAGPPVHLHFHCPDGSVLNAAGDVVKIEPWFPPELDLANAVERVARFLAMKQAVLKDVEHDIAEPEGDRQVRHQRWIDGNWPTFQDEAAELLAAAVPEGAGE